MMANTVLIFWFGLRVVKPGAKLIPAPTTIRDAQMWHLGR
jgi:hypothetical protein